MYWGRYDIILAGYSLILVMQRLGDRAKALFCAGTNCLFTSVTTFTLVKFMTTSKIKRDVLAGPSLQLLKYGIVITYLPACMLLGSCLLSDP